MYQIRYIDLDIKLMTVVNHPLVISYNNTNISESVSHLRSIIKLTDLELAYDISTP